MICLDQWDEAFLEGAAQIKAIQKKRGNAGRMVNSCLESRTAIDSADIVLPACSRFELNEDIGSVKTACGYVELQQKVIDPLFESRPDSEISKVVDKTDACSLLKVKGTSSQVYCHDKEGAARMKTMKKSVKVALGILVALMLVGTGCWIAQQTFGLGITGMSNGIFWGLYICLFLLFAGLGGIDFIWRMLTRPNYMGPLVWDLYVITLCTIMNVVELVFFVFEKEGAGLRRVRHGFWSRPAHPHPFRSAQGRLV